LAIYSQFRALLAPFYALEEREVEKKLRERLARLEEKEKWMIKKLCAGD
jgi:hypothetical protein